MPRPKIYKIDEETFSKKFTALSAYSLGLLLSDGHLSYRRGAIQYSCKTEDEYLIETILKCLQSTHPIKRYAVKGRSYSRMSISNIKLARNIINTFELPDSNKSSNNLFIPKNVPRKFMHHFLRGFFDGDGSIWKTANRFVCSYCGGENMLVGIQKILKDKNIISRMSYRYGKQNKNSCNITISNHQSIENFKNYLYRDAQNYLSRKYEMFNEHTKQFNKCKKRYLKFNGNGNIIRNLYEHGKTQKEISDSISIPFSTVRSYIQLLRKKFLVK